MNYFDSCFVCGYCSACGITYLKASSLEMTSLLFEMIYFAEGKKSSVTDVQSFITFLSIRTVICYFCE